MDATTLPYGDHPDQVADLVRPLGRPPAGGWPVLVVVHGGFWRDQYRRDLTIGLAEAAAERGYAAWNVEYRRVGGSGGWPETFADVAAAIDHLAVLDLPLDLDRVGTVGHSAGGHLALWAAARTKLPAGAPGHAPVVRPCAAVGLAAVTDLGRAEATGLSEGSVVDLLGGPSERLDERWAAADPIRLVGHGVPVLLATADEDESVPIEQSTRYLEAARRVGDPVEHTSAGGDHMAVIDPGSDQWARTLSFLDATC